MNTNPSVEIYEAFKASRPTPLIVGEGLCLYTDQRVERMRFRLAEPLLKEHGRTYKARPYLFPVHASVQDRCYDAAYAMAGLWQESLYYCEGFLMLQEGSAVLAHGWCMTHEGRIIDPVLHKHQHKDNVRYYGFPLRLSYVDTWFAKYGYTGLLDGCRNAQAPSIYTDSPDLWLQDY